MVWTMAAFYLHTSQQLLTLGKVQKTGFLIAAVISDHLPNPASIIELTKDVKDNIKGEIYGINIHTHTSNQVDKY